MATLREIQQFELQMLKDVAKACDENGIEYLLDSGTLLGAIRHGGFIPWDDDIDLYMTLENYKKFIKIGQRILGDKYFVQNYRTDNEYCEMWIQVRANGTTSMPKKLKNWNIHWGMCLDIFPIIGVSDDLIKKEKQKKALAINRTLLRDKYMLAKGEPINSKLKLIYKIPRPIRKFICRLNEHRYMLNPEKYNTCANIWYDITVEYPYKVFSPLTKVKFEDAEFTTTSKYDEYLTLLYGDYMTIPDESQRGGHSDELGSIIMDINKDYKKYKIGV